MARNRPRFPRGPRRGTDWAASAVQAAFITVPAASAVILETFTPFEEGETIVRVRGFLSWVSDQVSADEEQFGAFGMGIVSEQAATVGVTAVPHPATDAAWGGWLYHTFFSSKFEFGTAVGVNPNVAHGMVIDSKAMRKMGGNERLVSVVENTHPTHGFRFANSERLLSKVK